MRVYGKHHYADQQGADTGEGTRPLRAYETGLRRYARQSLDRIDARGRSGRQISRHTGRQDAHNQSDRRQPRWHFGRNIRGEVAVKEGGEAKPLSRRLHQDITNEDAQRRADQTERGGFEQEHIAYVMTQQAQRAQHADLVAALGGGNGHGVVHQRRADD